MRRNPGAAVALGLALALAVVASAAYVPVRHAGSAPYIVAFGPYRSADSTNGGQTSGGSITTATGGSPGQDGNGSDTANIMSLSQLGRLESQPPILSALVLLPVGAAILLGLALYRVSAARTEERRGPED